MHMLHAFLVELQLELQADLSTCIQLAWCVYMPET